MKPTIVFLVVAGVVALTALVEESSAATPVCPHCVCPPSYSPVCGYQKSTRRTRGFPSRCVLECTNKCRKLKFEFVHNGRCGKWSLSDSSEAPSTSSRAPSTTTTTMPPIPADPSLDDVEEQHEVTGTILEPPSER